MITKILPDNPELMDLILTVSDFLGVKAEIKTEITLTTDSDQLARIVDQLVAGQAEPEPRISNKLADAPHLLDMPVLVSPGFPDGTIAIGQNGKMHAAITNLAGGKTCEFCGTPVSGHAKVCGAAECKQKQQRKHTEAWKANKGKATATIIPPADIEPVQGNQEMAPAADPPLSEAGAKDIL